MVDVAVAGPTSNADGTQSNLRSGRQGDLIVSQLHGRYYENVSRGNVFALNLSVTSSTISAGNILAAAAAASTQFAIWNPATSGVNLSLLFFFFGLTSGTTPAGPLWHSQFASTLPTIASAGNLPVNCMLGNTTGPAARTVTSAAGTALTGGSALTAVRPMAITYSAGTYASLAGSYQAEETQGSIVVKPGAGWVPTWSGAGTTVLGTYGVVWEEVPI